MPNLNDLFVRDEARLSGKLYVKTVNTSVWLKLIPKEAWPDGMSDVLQVATSERNLPANPDVWSSIADPNNNSNNCSPAADVVPSGQTVRQYNLAVKALEAERVCVNDTRNAYSVSEQVKNMFNNLKKVVAYTWARRAKVEYARISEHKMIAANGLPEANALFPIIAPTSVLTQGILNKIYTNLLLDGAPEDGGSIDMVNGAYQFILVTDMETSDKIRAEDSITNAFLYNAKRVPELLQAFGVETAYRGFYHVMDNLPRRWKLTAGQWVEVMPYVTVPASRGVKSIINPEYVEAPYTDSYVFLPSVFSFMVPKPISTVGSGTEFKPQTYLGDFKWLNVVSVDPDSTYYNPDGAFGFYRALLSSGSKPVHPEYGYVIRHLRCPGDFGSQACPDTPAVNDTDLSGSDSYFAG